MTVILAFYLIGGAIGVLINLRFLLPVAYFDIRNAFGLIDTLQTIGYQLIRILILGCVAFFLSWISVGYLVIHYEDFKSELERIKL
jgi:hypothetical protein